MRLANIPKTRKKIALLGICICFASHALLAEEIERRTPVSELVAADFAQDLEQRLARDIRSYLNHEFFITQVNVQLDNVDTYKREEVLVPIPEEPNVAANNQPSNFAQTPDIPPQQPSQEELISQMELDTEDGISQNVLQHALGMNAPLPGLPLPQAVFDEPQRNVQKPKPRATPKAVEQASPPVKPVTPKYKKEIKEKLLRSTQEIRQLRVKIMLDDHVTPEQETFIRNLVIEKSSLSFFRGDEIKILRSNFPAAAILDQPIEEEPEEETVPEEIIPEPLPVLPWWQEYWPYIAAAGVLIALLLLLLLTRMNKSKVVEEAPVLESETTKKVEELIEKMHQKEDTVNENRLGAIKEELVSLSVTDKDLVSEQIKELLNSGAEESLEKLTILYALLGEGLFKGLATTYLTPEKQVAIAAKALDQNESMSFDEKLELAESSYQLLMQRHYQQQHDMQNEVRPFAFLERLNDDQILFLLKEEDLKVKALVMSQVSSHRGASLLKRFPDKGRSRIAMEISNFAKLPISAFRDIANRLAKRSVHVPSFDNLEMDGLDLLTDMLDHMNTAEESSLLNSLKRDNPDLYYKIKKIYISFDDIIKIPKMGLKNLIREFEREDLAMALYDGDTTFKQTIFDVMLERPCAMLKSAIDGLNNPDPESIQDAKRMVSRRARAMLKSGAFSMSARENVKQLKPRSA